MNQKTLEAEEYYAHRPKNFIRGETIKEYRDKKISKMKHDEWSGEGSFQVESLEQQKRTKLRKSEEWPRKCLLCQVSCRNQMCPPCNDSFKKGLQPHLSLVNIEVEHMIKVTVG